MIENSEHIDRRTVLKLIGGVALTGMMPHATIANPKTHIMRICVSDYFLRWFHHAPNKSSHLYIADRDIIILTVYDKRYYAHVTCLPQSDIPRQLLRIFCEESNQKLLHKQKIAIVSVIAEGEAFGEWSNYSFWPLEIESVDHEIYKRFCYSSIDGPIIFGLWNADLGEQPRI